MIPPPTSRDGLYQGHSMLIVLDATGAWSGGELASYSRATLHRLDVWLDSKDAANEGPDGSLPR